MSNLLEKIRANSAAKPAVSTNQGGQTESIRSLLQAKTGKASTPSAGPRQSNIREQIAGQQARQEGAMGQQTGQLQAGFLAEQEADIRQRGDQQEAQAGQKSKFLSEDFQRQTESLLNNFINEQKQLGAQRDISQIEQVGIAARLQNDQYINKLQNEASKNRMVSAKDFKTGLQSQILADNETLLKDEIAFKTLVEADDREFQRQLSNLDINYAIKMADDMAQAQNARQVAEGVGGLISGGAQAVKAFS